MSGVDPDVEGAQVAHLGPGEAPAHQPGRLVSFSKFKNYNSFAGLLAWIGDERIGRIDVDANGNAAWYVSLPSEDEAIDGQSQSVDEAKDTVESWAVRWIKRAGLRPLEPEETHPLFDPGG